MPFKHDAARRHRIPRARYRVTNWPAYAFGLRRRGDLTPWLDEAALDGWAAPERSTPCGQPLPSELATGLVLKLRLVAHLALCQAEAFSRDVLRLLGLGLTVPDHSTLSRRGRALAGRQPRVQAGASPVYLVLDSTGLELFGQGEWAAARHGRLRRPPTCFAGCPAGGSPAAMAQAAPCRRRRHGRDRRACADRGSRRRCRPSAGPAWADRGRGRARDRGRRL